MAYSEGGVEAFSLPQTCFSLLSAPPRLQQKLPGGYWPSGSLLNGVILGWGGACFHSLGAACCSKGCLPLTSGPAALLPSGFPNPPLCPDFAAGTLVRWQGLGRKTEHHVVSRNYGTGRVVRSLWIWGRGKGTGPQC